MRRPTVVDSPGLTRSLVSRPHLPTSQYRYVGKLDWSEPCLAVPSGCIRGRANRAATGGGGAMHGHAPPARAFEMLRRYSRNNHHRLVDVALAVLADPTSHPALTHPRR